MSWLGEAALGSTCRENDRAAAPHGADIRGERCAPLITLGRRGRTERTPATGSELLVRVVKLYVNQLAVYGLAAPGSAAVVWRAEGCKGRTERGPAAGEKSTARGLLLYHVRLLKGFVLRFRRHGDLDWSGKVFPLIPRTDQRSGGGRWGGRTVPIGCNDEGHDGRPGLTDRDG